MLLNRYPKRLSAPSAGPRPNRSTCIAHLDQDITEVIPYLNAALGGFQYIKDPPTALLQSCMGSSSRSIRGKICVNALKDQR